EGVRSVKRLFLGRPTSLAVIYVDGSMLTKGNMMVGGRRLHVPLELRDETAAYWIGTRFGMTDVAGLEISLATNFEETVEVFTRLVLDVLEFTCPVALTAPSAMQYPKGVRLLVRGFGSRQESLMGPVLLTLLTAGLTRKGSPDGWRAGEPLQEGGRGWSSGELSALLPAGLW
ncbi:hypothetical protein FOL47_002290, partial [Perkinsus chesapeaki]